jgi:hypothetical protein
VSVLSVEVSGSSLAQAPKKASDINKIKVFKVFKFLKFLKYLKSLKFFRFFNNNKTVLFIYFLIFNLFAPLPAAKRECAGLNALSGMAV